MASSDEINLFIGETDGLVRKIEEELINLDKDHSSNNNAIQQLFFVFNGLTRLISMINLENAAKLSNQIESMLEKAKNSGIPKNKASQFVNLMFDNFEILKSLIERIKEGKIKDLENIVMEDLQIKFEDLESEYEITFIEPIPQNKVDSIIKGKNFFQIFIRIKDTCKFKKVRLFFIFRGLNNIGQICYSNPEPEILEKGELDYEFEIFFMTENEEKAIMDILEEILEIENKFIKELNAEKFKKIIFKYDTKLKLEKEEEIRNLIELKGNDSEIESDFQENFFNPIEPVEVDELREDRSNIFYKIYIRLKIGCKFKNLRLFLIFRALNQIGRICWSNPDPKLLEQGKFNLDFEIYFISQEKKKDIYGNLEEITEISNKAVNEISCDDFKNIIENFVPKWKNEVEPPVKEEKEKISKDNENEAIYDEKMRNLEKKINEISKKPKIIQPRIIFTNNFGEMDKKIFLPNNSFIKLIENDNQDMIFSCHKENDLSKFVLYVIKDGVCFVSEENEFQQFKDKFNIYDGGFTNFHEFLDANKFGIEASVEYTTFRASEYYGTDINSYQIFQNSKK